MSLSTNPKTAVKLQPIPRVFITFYVGLALVTSASMLLCWFVLEGRVRTMARTDVSSKLSSETTLVAQMTASALLGPLSDDDVAVFSDDLRSVARTTNTRLSLVASDGKVIADSDDAESPTVNDEDRAQIATAGGVDALRDGRLVSIRPIRRGSKVLGYARSTCSASAIDARMTTLKRWALFVGFLFSASTMLLGLVLAQRIVSPIVGLRRAAERVARGELTYPVESSRQDEIGDLARSFNKMQRKVWTMLKDLETRERETREYSLVKDQLYIRLSHELRSPCNVIFNTLALLADDDSSAEKHDTLRIALRASEALHKALRDLDDFAQADVSGVSTRTTAFDPSALVEDALRVASVAVRGEASFTLHSVGKVRRIIRGDAFRLRFAVRCAVLFLMEGHSRASLHVEVDVPNANGIEVQVRFILENEAGEDGASGIDSHNARAACLAMCRHLVEATGGRVDLVEGPTTRLTLHTVNQPAVTNDLREKMEQTMTDKRETHKTNETVPRVLLVEDEPVNRLIARRVLEKQGFEVMVAENGACALEALLGGNIDIVLMDVEMPVMNGLQAVGKIREGESGTTRRLPVIAVTAHAMDGDRAKFIEAGMDDCVTKPFNPDDLRRIVMKWSGSAAAA